MGSLNYSSERLRGFFSRVEAILRSLDDLVEEYGLNEDVIMVNCIAVETDRDSFGTNIQATYHMSVFDESDILHLMTGAMDQYEKLQRNGKSNFMRVIDDNPYSPN